MKPLIILIAVFALFTGTSFLTTRHWNVSFGGNLAMCVLLCFTALGHFLFTKGMALMMPPFIPFKTGLVYVTGVLEVLLGFLLLDPSLRSPVGYGLMVFFVLLMPANIYAAVKRLDIEKGTYTGPGLSYLWFRIPLQLFFIGWIYYFSIFAG